MPIRKRGRPPKPRPTLPELVEHGQALADYLAALPEAERHRKLPLLAYAVVELGAGRPITDYLALAHEAHKRRGAAYRSIATLREWYAVGDLVRALHMADMTGLPLRVDPRKDPRRNPSAFTLVAAVCHKSPAYVKRAYDFARSFPPGVDPFGNFPEKD